MADEIATLDYAGESSAQRQDAIEPKRTSGLDEYDLGGLGEDGIDDSNNGRFDIVDDIANW